MATPAHSFSFYESPVRQRMPRIGGTAMPGGVHFSSGNYGTAPSWRLMLTGFVIILLGAVAMVIAYLLSWLAGVGTGLPYSEAMMDLARPADFTFFPLVQIARNLLIFLCFLVVLRLSPLAGYHGAEHKVVHCMEKYGVLDWDLARQSPRAHQRCGTTLLAGLLPIPILAVPLLGIPQGGLVLALAVALVGWTARFTVGAAIQRVFTTKEPTDRQLATALRSANLLLARWRQDPDRRISLLHSLWVRGFPQMVAGVILATELLEWLSTHLPFWLDYGYFLP